MSNFTPFPSIETFAHAVHNQSKNIISRGRTKVLYGFKIKLHGTNAAIRIDKDGTITAQSRKRDITLDYDNFNFAEWIEENRMYLESLSSDRDIIIYGEWAGNGVQKTDAINKISEKMFFPFAVHYDGLFFTDTYKVEDVFKGSHLKIPETINILPHLMYCEIDFGDPKSVMLATKEINELVEEIEKVDPYVFSKFGIEEVGEGIVGVPIYECGLNEEDFRNLSFKAKTQNHRGKKAKAAASGRFELSDDAIEMAMSYVTEARLNQGLQEGLNGELSMKRTGDFLKWIGGDIKKESATELEVAGMEWKNISGIISKASAQWYKQKVAEM